MAIKKFFDVVGEGYDRHAQPIIIWGKIADHLTQEGPRAVPELVNLLTNEDFVVRDWAAGLLGKVGPGASVAVPAIVGTMKNDKHSWVRVRAAWALWRIDGQVEKAAPALIDALRDSNPHVRRVAVLSFSEIGPLAKQFTPAVTKILQHENQFIRESAADALRHIDPELATKPVLG